jgi:hypothetical protein
MLTKVELTLQGNWGHVVVVLLGNLASNWCYALQTMKDYISQLTKKLVVVVGSINRSLGNNLTRASQFPCIGITFLL